MDPRLIGVLELLLALDFDSDLFNWRCTWSSRADDTALFSVPRDVVDNGTDSALEVAEGAGDTALLGPLLAALIRSTWSARLVFLWISSLCFLLISSILISSRWCARRIESSILISPPGGARSGMG